MNISKINVYLGPGGWCHEDMNNNLLKYVHIHLMYMYCIIIVHCTVLHKYCTSVHNTVLVYMYCINIVLVYIILY